MGIIIVMIFALTAGESYSYSNSYSTILGLDKATTENIEELDRNLTAEIREVSRDIVRLQRAVEENTEELNSIRKVVYLMSFISILRILPRRWLSPVLKYGKKFLGIGG